MPNRVVLVLLPLPLPLLPSVGESICGRPSSPHRQTRLDTLLKDWHAPRVRSQTPTAPRLVGKGALPKDEPLLQRFQTRLPTTRVLTPASTRSNTSSGSRTLDRLDRCHATLCPPWCPRKACNSPDGRASQCYRRTVQTLISPVATTHTPILHRPPLLGRPPEPQEWDQAVATSLAKRILEPVSRRPRNGSCAHRYRRLATQGSAPPYRRTGNTTSCCTAALTYRTPPTCSTGPAPCQRVPADLQAGSKRHFQT